MSIIPFPCLHILFQNIIASYVLFKNEPIIKIEVQPFGCISIFTNFLSQLLEEHFMTIESQFYASKAAQKRLRLARPIRIPSFTSSLPSYSIAISPSYPLFFKTFKHCTTGTAP